MGAEPVHSELQRRRTPDPATYIGKGKVDELRAVGEALDIDVVIFDDELSPAQQRNLEKLFAVDVVDRVGAHPRLFAQHATTRRVRSRSSSRSCATGYRACAAAGLQLSQQGEGIGTRGPGETQLEVDRRRLLRRMQKLERDLVGLAATCATQRKARKRRDVPHVALVGYTNVGKSTLLNRLTHAGVLVENQLFSTLDPTVRRLHLPGGETVVLSDTVGFVRRLPHQLVEAFRSTLEEVVDADLLVHLVDASAPDVEALMHAVDTVLHEIEADQVPRLLVWNKADLADPDDVKSLLGAYPGSVAISAATGDGVPELLVVVGDRLRALAYHRVRRAVRARRRARRAGPRGEVLVEVHGDHAARAGPALRSGRRSLRRVRPRPRLVSVRMAATGGFVPPPYPYERLDALKLLADSLPGGVVDCSIGTPCDPVPAVASRAASAALAASNGLSTVGRQRGLARRRRGVDRAAVRCRGGGCGRRCVRGDQGAGRVAAAPLAAPHAGARDGAVPGDRVPELRDGRGARRVPRERPSRSTRSGTSTSTRSATRTPRVHSCCGSTSPATRRHRPPDPITSRGLRRGGATTA